MARIPKRAAPRRVATVLTFRKLVARAPDPAQAIETVRSGLPASAIDEAVNYMDVPRKDLLAALRIPVSTFHRRLAANEPLSPAESEKVLRLGEITRRAESPRPMPTSIRPPEISCRVAMAAADTVTSRVAGFVTQGPIRTREVFAAIIVNVV